MAVSFFKKNRKNKAFAVTLRPMAVKWISLAGLVLVGVAALTLTSVRDHRSEVTKSVRSARSGAHFQPSTDCSRPEEGEPDSAMIGMLLLCEESQSVTLCLDAHCAAA